MSNAAEIARMLTPRQRQALQILVSAERLLRNKDFHEIFETDARRTTGWSKALGPCTKAQNHDPKSLWARRLVTVIDNRYYKITSVGCKVAAVIESAAIRPTARYDVLCADSTPKIRPSENTKELSRLTLQTQRPSEQLREFRLELDKLLPSSISRPFLCDGSPLECSIFIIGTNSAREVEKPFWSFWSDSCGFHKAEYIRELEQLRGGLTVTRKNIEIVARAAGSAVTLDTNIYLQPTPTEADLKREDKRTEVVEHLLKTIRPKVVLAHGVQAKKFFERRCRHFVDNGLAHNKITWDAWEWHFRLLCSHHLSFQGKGVTHSEEAERIGQALASALH